MWDQVQDRDRRFGVDTNKKLQARKDLPRMDPHQDSDSCWK